MEYKKNPEEQNSQKKDENENVIDISKLSKEELGEYCDEYNVGNTLNQNNQKNIIETKSSVNLSNMSYLINKSKSENDLTDIKKNNKNKSLV